MLVGITMQMMSWSSMRIGWARAGRSQMRAKKLSPDRGELYVKSECKKEARGDGWSYSPRFKLLDGGRRLRERE